MERPGARCAKQRASGHFPAKSKPKGPAAQPGRPRFYPILIARTALRPPHTSAAVRASPLPFLASPLHPHAKGPAA